MSQQDPVEPPRLPWETPRQTPQQAPDPTRGGYGGYPRKDGHGPPMALVGMAIVMVVSLIANGIFAVTLRNRQDALDAATRREAALHEELSKLRAGLRQGSGETPLQALQKAVQRIRGLSFRAGVKPEVVTPAGLRERVAAQFQRDNPRADIDESDRVLTTLGLLRPNEDLYKILLQVNQEVVGGFYDTRTKRLVVAGDASSPSPLDRFLLAHELTHALTDQHFNLSRYDDLSEKDADDAATAYLCIAEGDASLTAAIYEQEVLTDQERTLLGSELAQTPRSAFDASPEFLQRTLLFPYQEGLAFVRALHERGGFALVDGAYKDPPSSTEQILHPARYLENRDRPQPVQMPDVAAALGAGWRNAQRGEAGEFDVRLILDIGQARGLSSSDANAGAAGWDGGRYQSLESKTGTVVAMLTVWDDESQAREAGEAFGRWLPLRFGNKGNAMGTGTALGRGWQSPEGAGVEIRKGSQLLLVMGPNADSVQRVRRAFPGF